MGHIPSAIQQLKIACRYRERIPNGKFSKRPERDAGGLAPQLTREPCIRAKTNQISLHESSLISQNEYCQLRKNRLFASLRLPFATKQGYKR